MENKIGWDKKKAALQHFFLDLCIFVQLQKIIFQQHKTFERQ
jgi:hypothetical protein